MIIILGKIKDYKTYGSIISIIYENGEVNVDVINSSIVNFFQPIFRKEKLSKAVEYIKREECLIQTELQEGILNISTEKLRIKVFSNFKVDIYDNNGKLLCEDYKGERKPFIRRSRNAKLAEAEGHKIAVDKEFEVFIAKTMKENMCFYGLGDKTGHLNKKWKHYRNWNTDNPDPHGETFEQLYKSIPFFITLDEEDAYGIFFDNSFEAHFDFGKENKDYFYFSAVDGNLDYYFIYGPTIKEVVQGYTWLTGTQKLPQLWTLGYHQSRFSYISDNRVLEVAEKFREKDIPCDCIHLDIDYMDGFRVFTWNKEGFPNPKDMIKKLEEKGFKVVTIIDPGVKKDTRYKIYNEGIKNNYFATDKDDVVYANTVWPGKSVYPDFFNLEVRKWWGNNHKVLFDAGVKGIWTDMNEPSSFEGPIPDDVKFNNDGITINHNEAHNVYGHMMSKATYEGIKALTSKRPFVITRAAYSGTQKYSTVWTGDNHSTWEHLRMAVPMLINLGLSGINFSGTDIGGFGSDSNGELLSRWIQFGIFSPLLRNHSIDNSRDQEPWEFDNITEDINRKYIKLRYKLIPYLYDLMWECEKNGSPVIRPLVYNYQNDVDTYECNDQFMCGENIMVAPVVEQGVKRRLVYLPKGDNWIDFYTLEEHEGGQAIIKDAPLDICPMYIKAGSMIPKYPEQNFIGEKEIDELKVDVYLSKNTTKTVYNHYLDDGESFEYEEGIYNQYEIVIDNDEIINIKIDIKNNKYHKKYKSIKFNIFDGENKEVYVNNIKVNLEKKDRESKETHYSHTFIGVTSN